MPDGFYLVELIVTGQQESFEVCLYRERILFAKRQQSSELIYASIWERLEKFEGHWYDVKPFQKHVLAHH